jgi:hypothetical protein
MGKGRGEEDRYSTHHRVGKRDKGGRQRCNRSPETLVNLQKGA